MARFVVGDTEHATRDAAILDIVDRNDYVNVTCCEYLDARNSLLSEWRVTDIDDGDLRILAAFNPEYRASIEDIMRRKPALERAIEAKRGFDEQTAPTSTRESVVKEDKPFDKKTAPTSTHETQQTPKRKRWWSRVLKACRSHCCACCVPSAEVSAPTSRLDVMLDLPATKPYTTTTYSVPQPYVASFA